jgi:hypothetical protein
VRTSRSSTAAVSGPTCAGDLHYGALFEAMPFDNRVATVRMRGEISRRSAAKNLATDKALLSLRASWRTCTGTSISITLTRAAGRSSATTRRCRRHQRLFATGGDDAGIGAGEVNVLPEPP